MNRNPLLCTDVYKMGHMEQYPPGTTKVYSYLQARTDKKVSATVFYGLQYYLKMLEQPITKEMADEFLEYREMMLGFPAPQDIVDKMDALVKLGYFPLKIRAVREGSVIPVSNVLFTMENTVPGFHWLVGFVESLLLKVWNTCTVASYSRELQRMCKKYSDETCDNGEHLPFQVHDFGYRGCSSEETAALSGSAHLIHFFGTDTVPAVKLVKETYGCEGPIGLSVPATEHSVMCAYLEANEFQAFERILDLYPTGIVSIVSDTYNLWRVLTDFAPRLKKRILAREGKVVFRPDSGDPPKIINGDITAKIGSPEWDGCIRLLDRVFGSEVNKKGFKVINPKVGLIYGEGMYNERLNGIFGTMRDLGYASCNLVTGIGGLLLQRHNRDDQGFALKATFAEVDGEERELEKDPVTDRRKKSHKGLLALMKDGEGNYYTKDRCTPEEEQASLLEDVFLDGKIVRLVTFNQIRELAAKS